MQDTVRRAVISPPLFREPARTSMWAAIGFGALGLAMIICLFCVAILLPNAWFKRSKLRTRWTFS